MLLRSSSQIVELKNVSGEARYQRLNLRNLNACNRIWAVTLCSVRGIDVNTGKVQDWTGGKSSSQ
jgi:hypothetical protein